PQRLGLDRLPVDRRLRARRSGGRGHEHGCHDWDPSHGAVHSWSLLRRFYMPSTSFRVGLIVPSSNTVMEPDFHRVLGAACAISTSRVYLEQVTRDAEQTMIDDDLPKALRLIKTTDPHVIVFGCTSAGSLGGLQSDAGIARRIEELTGVRALTVVGSVVEQLKTIQPRTVAVFTPYREELTRTVSDCVVEAGFRLGPVAGMGI